MSWWRVGALWAVLVVLFVAFYLLVGAARLGAAFWGVVLVVVALVVVVVVTVLILRLRAGANLNNEGIALLGQGRLVEALARFEQARKGMTGGNAPLIHHNLGVTKLALWRLEEADLELTTAGKKRSMTDLSRLIVPQHALVLALMGRWSDATATLAKADKLGLEHHASSILARGVLAARAGDWANAERLLGRREIKQLGGVTRALADAVFAWALHQQTGQLRHVDRVTLFGEAGSDSLRRHWPELEAFLQQAPQA